MKRFLKNLTVFIVIFMFFLVLKKNIIPYFLGDKIYLAKHKNFIPQIGKYNSVIFGSSRLYRQLNPILLDTLLKKYEISTYNFANGATYNPESYFLFENFLDKLDSGAIKYAFIEIQTLHQFSMSNCKTTKASYWNTEKYLLYSINYILDSDYSNEKKKQMIECYLKSYLFGLQDFSFIKNIFSSDEIKGIGSNGFYPLENEMNNGESYDLKKRLEEYFADTTVILERVIPAKWSEESLSPKALNKYHLKYLHSLIKKSFKKGIHLIFILPPRLTSDQYLELIPLSNSLPQENIIKLYSYYKFPEFYMSEYSFDIGHLNSKGANIFTKYFSIEADALFKEIFLEP